MKFFGLLKCVTIWYKSQALSKVITMILYDKFGELRMIYDIYKKKNHILNSIFAYYVHYKYLVFTYSFHLYLSTYLPTYLPVMGSEIRQRMLKSSYVTHLWHAFGKVASTLWFLSVVK